MLQLILIVAFTDMYTRLPFGVQSASTIIIIISALQGLPKIVCYLDDIFVTGSTEKENQKNMEHVLLQLKQSGVKVC